jgi:hypothetical protein
MPSRSHGRSHANAREQRQSCDDSENTRRLRISSFYADTPGELLTAVAMKMPRMLRPAVAAEERARIDRGMARFVALPYAPSGRGVSSWRCLRGSIRVPDDLP